MRYIHVIFFVLLMVALAACGTPNKGSRPDTTTIVDVTVRFSGQQHAISPQAIPNDSSGKQIDWTGEIKVFEGGTEVKFDADGNITTSSSTPIIVTVSKPSTQLKLAKGKTYKFEFIGYETGKPANKLIYGELEQVITGNSSLYLKLYTIIDKEMIKLERRDKQGSQAIEANTLVEYYLTVNASNRQDLFATIADFNAVEYINTLGTIGNISDVGAQFKIPVSVLPDCGKKNTEFSVKLKGYVNNNGTIVEETFTSPKVQIELLHSNGLTIADCQNTNPTVDSVEPAINVALATGSTATDIKVTGSVADMHSGVDRIEVFDGVTKLANVTLDFGQSTDRKGPFNFTWELKGNTTSRTLRFVAYDKANNTSESTQLTISAPNGNPTPKVCKGDFNINRHQLSPKDLDALIDTVKTCSHIDGTLTIISTTKLMNLDRLNSITGNLVMMDVAAISFNTLTSIGGEFRIWGTGVAEGIAYIEGFNALQSVGGDFSIANNSFLKNINAFNNLKSIGGQFLLSDNTPLEKVTGFHSLKSVKGDFTIQYLHLITDIDWFSNLDTIGGVLSIYNNSSLQRISSLQNLSIGGAQKSISNNRNFDCTIYNNNPPAYFPLTNSEGNKVNCTVQ